MFIDLQTALYAYCSHLEPYSDLRHEPQDAALNAIEESIVTHYSTNENPNATGVHLDIKVTGGYPTLTSVETEYPHPITIYRGARPNAKVSSSWTTDISIARRYASARASELCQFIFWERNHMEQAQQEWKHHHSWYDPFGPGRAEGRINIYQITLNPDEQRECAYRIHLHGKIQTPVMLTPPEPIEETLLTNYNELDRVWLRSKMRVAETITEPKTVLDITNPTFRPITKDESEQIMNCR